MMQHAMVADGCHVERRSCLASFTAASTASEPVVTKRKLSRPLGITFLGAANDFRFSQLSLDVIGTMSVVRGYLSIVHCLYSILYT